MSTFFNDKITLPIAVPILVAGLAVVGSFSWLNVYSLRAVAHDMKPATGHEHGAAHQAHQAVEVPPGNPVPSVNLIVRPDAQKGWNLEVKVTNFTFAPERVNTKSTSVNEGHAHLYVDGKKRSRLYGSWYHLEHLPPGTHQVTVTLNTNDHGELRYQGKPIQATVTVQVPVPQK